MIDIRTNWMAILTDWPVVEESSAMSVSTDPSASTESSSSWKHNTTTSGPAFTNILIHRFFLFLKFWPPVHHLFPPPLQFWQYFNQNFSHSWEHWHKEGVNIYLRSFPEDQYWPPPHHPFLPPLHFVNILSKSFRLFRIFCNNKGVDIYLRRFHSIWPLNTYSSPISSTFAVLTIFESKCFRLLRTLP